jgi:hypothetical protein
MTSTALPRQAHGLDGLVLAIGEVGADLGFLGPDRSADVGGVEDGTGGVDQPLDGLSDGLFSREDGGGGVGLLDR